MKTVCHRESLLAASQLAGVAVSSRDVKPVLRNLKAVVEADRCTLMATDLELGIRLEVKGVKVEEPGEALLPASRLVAILRESIDDEVTIEAGPERCFIRSQHNEFEMPGEDPAAFPDIPAFAEENYHQISAGALREMIRRTIFAPAVSEQAKYSATTGLLWELEDERATLVATDGRRLAVACSPAQVHGDHSTKNQMPVVPAKALSLLERNLAGPDEPVLISLRPNEVLMKTKQAMIYSRLVEGRFPSYRQVLPPKCNHKIPLTVGPFYSAIRQAAIMTDEESKRVVFNFAKKKLTLQARGSEVGRSHVEMPLDYEGKTVEISFDPKFVTDMLRILDPSTSLVLELVDGGVPAVFRYGPDYLYVVVPLVVPAAAKAEAPPT